MNWELASFYSIYVYFNRCPFVGCRINPHLVMFTKMKFEPLVNILQTNSPTFELTLTTIARILESNAVILNADDYSSILFLNRNSNMSLTSFSLMPW